MPAKKKKAPAARKRKPAVSDQVQQPPAASQPAGDPRTLTRQTVICSLPNRSGKWTVEEDEGGKVVCISRRVPALKTWVDRSTLTIVTK
jgi:hypothetical protein